MLGLELVGRGGVTHVWARAATVVVGVECGLHGSRVVSHNVSSRTNKVLLTEVVGSEGVGSLGGGELSR